MLKLSWLICIQRVQRNIHLFRPFSSFLVGLEISTMVAVPQCIPCHPLIVTISTLCGNSCNFHVWTIQINLEPLMYIITSWWPRPCFPCPFIIQSTLPSRMIIIPMWRGAYLSIGNCTISHTKSFLTFWWYTKKFTKISLKTSHKIVCMTEAIKILWKRRIKGKVLF